MTNLQFLTLLLVIYVSPAVPDKHRVASVVAVLVMILLNLLDLI